MIPISTTFRVGKKFICSMTFANGALTAEWSPMPRRLRQREWADYRAGRDAFLAEIAKAIGGPVLTVEPGQSKTRVTVSHPADARRTRGSA